MKIGELGLLIPYGHIKMRNWLNIPGKSVLLQEIEQDNLCLDAGELYILTRMKENNSTTYRPVGYMVVGRGVAQPQGTDTLTQMGSNLAYAVATPVVNAGLNKVVWSGNLTAAQLNQATCIGLITTNDGNGTLVTRALFDAAISIPAGSSMDIDYEWGLRAASVVVGWGAGGYSDTWKVAMPQSVNVQFVDEIRAGAPCGFIRKTTEAEVHAQPNSYCHINDGGTWRLIIRGSNGTNNPDSEAGANTIIVTRG